MSRLESPTPFELRKLRIIADVQFGKGTGKILFPDAILVERSRATKRIRYVFLNNKRICSFRVQDGYLTLSLAGGELLAKNGLGKKVVIDNESEPFVRDGKSVFAQHVIYADENIGVRDEVIILNNHKELVAIGTAKLSSRLMLELNKGVAVSVRKGMKKK